QVEQTPIQTLRDARSRLTRIPTPETGAFERATTVPKAITPLPAPLSGRAPRACRTASRAVERVVRAGPSTTGGTAAQSKSCPTADPPRTPDRSPPQARKRA